LRVIVFATTCGLSKKNTIGCPVAGTDKPTYKTGQVRMLPHATVRAPVRNHIQDKGVACSHFPPDLFRLQQLHIPIAHQLTPQVFL
jgi:hypothetical protein